MIRRSDGFTAVELLIALVVGVLLLGSAYQLFTVVLRDSGSTQQRGIASAYAYTLLRQYEKNTSVVTSPCTTSSNTPAIPASVGLSPQSTASVVVSCPYSNSTGVSLVTVTINYFTPIQERVVRAIVIQP